MIRENQSLSLAILRIALSGVFLWFGYTQLQNPQAWVSFVPEFVSVLGVPFTTLVILNGTLELFLGVLLLFGVFSRISALVLGLHLFGIAAPMGISPTAVRDIGLACATISLAVSGPGGFSLDYHLPFRYQPRVARAGKLAIIVIAFIIAGVTGVRALVSSGAVTLPYTQKPNTVLESTPSNSSGSDTSPLTQPKAGDVFNREEVAQHNAQTDCWVIISDKVYGVTSFITSHPGGAENIIKNCGKDATPDFSAIPQHARSSMVKQLLGSFYIGDLK